jgi:hypothetical protein
MDDMMESIEAVTINVRDNNSTSDLPLSTGFCSYHYLLMKDENQQKEVT